MDYIISIKVKNQHWYECAEEFGGEKLFSKWDDGKTPRYKKGTTFKFAFSIKSIEKLNQNSYTIRQYRNIQKDDFVEVQFDDIFIMKFHGDIETELAISKSVIE